MEALGDEADPPGTIRGDRPDSVTLGSVWLALQVSLENILRRAIAAKAAAAKSAENPADPESIRPEAQPEDPPAEAETA